MYEFDKESLPILTIANLDIDFRSRSYFPMDYAGLFPPDSGEEWEYKWDVYEDEEIYSEIKLRFRAPLWVIVKRLNLSGWNEDLNRTLYEDEARDSLDVARRVFSRDVPPFPTYESLAIGVSSINVREVPKHFEARGPDSPWYQAAAVAMQEDGGRAIADGTQNPIDEYRLKIEQLNTATIIHMLARNPANRDKDIIWWAYSEVIYGDTEEEEYANRIGASPDERVMIVTEGKSDTSIIEKSLSILRPHIKDYFTFIDMSDNYPFTGVGSLTNFYKGLQKIGILNSILMIFDNDAVGVSNYNEALAMSKLSNVRPLKLPNLDSVTQFHTVGPTGEHVVDINGRAVSIECFLDLSWEIDSVPSVRWTSYQKSADTYQGELIGKEAMVRKFLKLTPEQVEAYDMSNLETLLDSIAAEAERIAVARLQNGLLD